MPASENPGPSCAAGSGPAWAPPSRRRLRTRLVARLAVLGTVLLVSLSPIIASQCAPSQTSVSSLAMGTEAGLQGISTSGYAVPSNLSYCGLLGPDPGTSANLPNYVQNVSILWNKTCVLPSFIEAIDQWGNLYLAYTGGSNNSTYWASGNLSVETILSRIPAVLFVVDFSSQCPNAPAGAGPGCQYETHWTGNVSTNELTGPTTSEVNCSDCSSPGPISAGFPYGLVLGFSLAGAFAAGVVIRVRRSR
jgi:hypothetical protein